MLMSIYKGCDKIHMLLLEFNYAKTTINRKFRLSANERDIIWKLLF